jgi:hypothetical protein
MEEVHGDRLVCGLLTPLMQALEGTDRPGRDAVAALLARVGEVEAAPSETVGTPAAEPISSRRRSRHARSYLVR